MILYILLFLFCLFGIFVPLLMFINTVFLIRSDLSGAPYVPTSSKVIDEILRRAGLRKKQIFLELGSGDGRVTRMAVKKYGVYGIGVDIHPLLVIYSNLIAKLEKLNNINFNKKDFFKIDFKKADVIFLFLRSDTLSKLKPKILKSCKGNTLIISHGFKFAGLEKFLVSQIDRSDFSTYYYRLP